METLLGRLRIGRTDRHAWGLSETDWARYESLMTGTAGLWYSHLPPTWVLGIHATSEAERGRFARLVWQQEQERLDALFRFNRAYQDVVREERSRPGFGLLLEEETRSRIHRISDSLDRSRERIQLFVRPQCEACVRAARALTDSGRPLDVWFVSVSSDLEVRRWAQQAGIPADRVRNRSVTLNHDRGLLGRAGHDPGALPILFRDSGLEEPVSLQSVLSGGGG